VKEKSKKEGDNMQGILLDNFTFLELLGILSQNPPSVKLSPNVVVLRDDAPKLERFPKVFTIDKLFGGTEFLLEEFRQLLNTLPYLDKFRVFFAHFRPYNGKITQRKDRWEKFKAWRFDIDHLYPEEHIWNLIEKLPLKPNIVKKSNKGWHLIYVFDEFVERNTYESYLHENDEDGYLHFMVYRLLTSHIPSYLKSIEEKLDAHASSLVNMIATRFVSEKLPAYLLHEPYPLSEFFDAFSHLIPKLSTNGQHTNGQPQTQANGKGRTLHDAVERYYKAHKSSPYKVEDIPRETFYSLLERCEVLKALDKVWENHSYDEWVIMANYQAVKILYTENKEEEQALRQEFHEKSQKHPKYTREEADYYLDYAIKRQREHLKLSGCGYIYRVIRKEFRAICEGCPYKRIGLNGLIEGHFIFDALRGLRKKKKAEALQSQTKPQTQKGLRKRRKAEKAQPQPHQTHPYPTNSEEPQETTHPYPLEEPQLHEKVEEPQDPQIPNWELREDGWYLLEGGYAVKVLPYFRIRTHYIVGDTEDEYVEITDKQSRSYIKKVERRKDTYMPTPELVKSFGFVNPDKIKEAKRFLAYYIEHVKEKRGVRIDFLGYRYLNGWDIAVGGDGTYTRKELSFIFYGKDLEHSTEWFLPAVKGDLETFKEIYRKLFAIDDPPLHFAIAHYLSWIAKQFLRGSSSLPYINPVLIFVGDTGTGKSIRAKLSAGLYGNPALFSFTNITLASFNNHFPLLKVPFGIDEVITKTERDEAKFGELIYNITNIQGKKTYSTTYNPIEVPVLITGETENLLIDKVFASFRGLNRRSIVLELTTDWKDNADVLDEAAELLYSHHGHILSYVKGLTERDKEWIKEMAKHIYGYEKIQNLGDASFRDLRKHIAISLAMFAHFFFYFIKAGTDEEIARKLAGVLDFVVEQITRNQVGRVGENIDYVEEVMAFLSKLDEFMGKHKNVKLYGLSFKRVCQMLNYTPSHRVGELLKKFFWKRYTEKNKTEKKDTEKNRTGTKLYFTPSCLITRPTFDFSRPSFSSEAPEVVYDRERLVRFTEEEARIWLEVFVLRHGDWLIKYLVNTFELDKLPQFKNLVNSFPEHEQILLYDSREVEKEIKETLKEGIEEYEEELDFDF
jgi:hypothetical protein